MAVIDRSRLVVDDTMFQGTTIDPSRLMPEGQDQLGQASTFPQAPQGEMSFVQGRPKIFDMAQSMLQRYATPVLGGLGGALGVAATPQTPTIGGSIGMEAGEELGGLTSKAFEGLGFPGGYRDPYAGKSFGEEAISGTVESAADIARNMILGKGTEIAGRGAFGLESGLRDTVKKYFGKGIRPSATKFKTEGAIERYYDDAALGVDTVRKGTTKPIETVQEFSEAIGNTKNRLVNQWKALSSEYGKAGNMVDRRPMITEMRDLANQPEIAAHSPELAKWLQKEADRLSDLPLKIPLDEAEKTLAILNSKAKSWWRSTNPNDLDKSLVYARQAHNLRQQILDTMQNAGPQYAELRKRYGALTEIEQDVAKRSAQKLGIEAQGFMDLASAQGTGSFVYGLMRADPGAMGAGAAIKGASAYKRWLNDPDRLIKKMFEKVAGE